MCTGDRRADGQDWAKIGVEALVTPVSFAGMVTDFLTPRTYEAALTDLGADGRSRSVSAMALEPDWAAGQNYTGWRNAEADGLMEQARA